MTMRAIRSTLAIVALLACGVAHAESDAAKQAETAEAIALSLLVQQAQAAAAPANALDAERKDVAVSAAAIDALLQHSPNSPQSAAGYWAMAQVDHAGLAAIAAVYQARAAAEAAATAGRDVWASAALYAANGLVSRVH
ncbi:hypothetical protein [Caballeronia zhejiangensis]|uniref:hypothetical protein n=1 Tax=Caballeronia zhejiangensis TaxID=871203 RepID=UPI001F525317|nr:hypothetical protein [Caballeronia zhejiangensis]MCI1041797.1 hypothetical protein [Caballeronia zhejiangensis]